MRFPQEDVTGLSLKEAKLICQDPLSLCQKALEFFDRKRITLEEMVSLMGGQHTQYGGGGQRLL